MENLNPSNSTPNLAAQGAARSSDLGPIGLQIEAKLAQHFALDHLQVMNESGNHNVPAGSESHFKVVLVGESFGDQNRLARHRAVHQVLADELSNDIHALAIHAFTGAEWQARFGDAPLSPPCLGGEGASTTSGTP